MIGNDGNRKRKGAFEEKAIETASKASKNIGREEVNRIKVEMTRGFSELISANSPQMQLDEAHKAGDITLVANKAGVERTGLSLLAKALKDVGEEPAVSPDEASSSTVAAGASQSAEGVKSEGQLAAIAKDRERDGAVEHLRDGVERVPLASVLDE